MATSDDDPAIITPSPPRDNGVHTPHQFSGEEKDDGDAPPAGNPPPVPLGPRMLHLLGDMTASPAYRFAQWLDSVRRRSSKLRSSGFPNRSMKLDPVLSNSSLDTHCAEPSTLSGSIVPSPSEQPREISLWERLGSSEMMDIECNDFSWSSLSSLHHTEHSSSSEQPEDEMSKVMEVTVNSGGVVFFAIFKDAQSDDVAKKETAAVIKISSSRMATQSERLGYELAKWLGVHTPQARVIHNGSSEWQQIKVATEKARETAISDGDEVGELTCTELLEALEISRCILLMNYVHGCPLLESCNAFISEESAKRTASALGRVLLLDLVIRNEDRLPCRQLGWRGNSANLLFTEKIFSSRTNGLNEDINPHLKKYKSKAITLIQNEKRSVSMDSQVRPSKSVLASETSESHVITPLVSWSSIDSQSSLEIKSDYFQIVAIDSGVPRRPPAGKRVGDQTIYPKLVELLLNNYGYASNLLYEITGGKLGMSEDEDVVCTSITGTTVQEFRTGFREALRDLQGFHLFLVTLYQKLDNLLRLFLTIINRSYGDSEKEEFMFDSSGPVPISPIPLSKEQVLNEIYDIESQRVGLRPTASPRRESSDSVSPNSRDNWHGKNNKGNGDNFRSLRMTIKLRDFNKYAKMDAELCREVDQWNDTLRTDLMKLCKEHNFNPGFWEGNDNSSVVDAYELKVRLEHILERIALISEAANTERPTMITSTLFIGGALAARSIYTLKHLGITHILCLCSNEIGQSDSQFPDTFEYKNFSICDRDDAQINEIFSVTADFIDKAEHSGKKVLVHCFEGKSRSATIVLAYLMLRKNYTLSEAWTTLKRVHRRAQPNDGFARALSDLDRKLHGKVSMEWQHRRPVMRVCPICGENAGLSSSSLKLHVQKSHRKLSSGSVDSAMSLEIQKALAALKIDRSTSVSPSQKKSVSMID